MNLRGMIAQMQTGMPSGPVATGTPKHAPKPSPVSHLEAALSHAKAGKHAEAKTHALKAVNVLHKHFAAPPGGMHPADPAAGAAV